MNTTLLLWNCYFATEDTNKYNAFHTGNNPIQLQCVCELRRSLTETEQSILGSFDKIGIEYSRYDKTKLTSVQNFQPFYFRMTWMVDLNLLKSNQNLDGTEEERMVEIKLTRGTFKKTENSMRMLLGVIATDNEDYAFDIKNKNTKCKNDTGATVLLPMRRADNGNLNYAGLSTFTYDNDKYTIDTRNAGDNLEMNIFKLFSGTAEGKRIAKIVDVKDYKVKINRKSNNSEMSALDFLSNVQSKIFLFHSEESNLLEDENMKHLFDTESDGYATYTCTFDVTNYSFHYNDTEIPTDNEIMKKDLNEPITDCLNKCATFMNENGVTDEMIVKATQNHLKIYIDNVVLIGQMAKKDIQTAIQKIQDIDVEKISSLCWKQREKLSTYLGNEMCVYHPEKRKEDYLQDVFLKSYYGKEDILVAHNGGEKDVTHSIKIVADLIQERDSDRKEGNVINSDDFRTITDLFTNILENHCRAGFTIQFNKIVNGESTENKEFLNNFLVGLKYRLDAIQGTYLGNATLTGVDVKTISEEMNKFVVELTSTIGEFDEHMQKYLVDQKEMIEERLIKRDSESEIDIESLRILKEKFQLSATETFGFQIAAALGDAEKSFDKTVIFDSIKNEFNRILEESLVKINQEILGEMFDDLKTKILTEKANKKQLSEEEVLIYEGEFDRKYNDKLAQIDKTVYPSKDKQELKVYQEMLEEYEIEKILGEFEKIKDDINIHFRGYIYPINASKEKLSEQDHEDAQSIIDKDCDIIDTQIQEIKSSTTDNTAVLEQLRNFHIRKQEEIQTKIEMYKLQKEEYKQFVNGVEILEGYFAAETCEEYKRSRADRFEKYLTIIEEGWVRKDATEIEKHKELLVILTMETRFIDEVRNENEFPQISFNEFLEKVEQKMNVELDGKMITEINEKIGEITDLINKHVDRERQKIESCSFDEEEVNRQVAAVKAKEDEKLSTLQGLPDTKEKLRKLLTLHHEMERCEECAVKIIDFEKNLDETAVKYFETKFAPKEENAERIKVAVANVKTIVKGELDAELEKNEELKEVVVLETFLTQLKASVLPVCGTILEINNHADSVGNEFEANLKLMKVEEVLAINKVEEYKRRINSSETFNAQVVLIKQSILLEGNDLCDKIKKIIEELISDKNKEEKRFIDIQNTCVNKVWDIVKDVEQLDEKTEKENLFIETVKMYMDKLINKITATTTLNEEVAIIKNIVNEMEQELSNNEKLAGLIKNSISLEKFKEKIKLEDEEAKRIADEEEKSIKVEEEKKEGLSLVMKIVIGIGSGVFVLVLALIFYYVFVVRKRNSLGKNNTIHITHKHEELI